MYNRLREMLVREGMINDDASEPEIRQAVDNWLEMVARAQRGDKVAH
jgi:hypothetical protein